VARVREEEGDLSGTTNGSKGRAARPAAERFQEKGSQAMKKNWAKSEKSCRINLFEFSQGFWV
jgi:hypothetical protein